MNNYRTIHIFSLSHDDKSTSHTVVYKNCNNDKDERPRSTLIRDVEYAVLMSTYSGAPLERVPWVPGNPSILRKV